MKSMTSRWVLAAAVGALSISACSSTSDPGGPDALAPSTPTTSAPIDPATGCSTPPRPAAGPPVYASPSAPTSPSAARVEATLHTTCGDITVELYGDKAPHAVASFEFLADDGYWENGPCHRLTTGSIFVLQCGDPTGTGRGGPGYTFGVENAPADGNYPPGTLAMARSNDPNSNGGQFFIVYQQTKLPVTSGGYTIFGKVTGGIEIIDRVAADGVAGGGVDGPPAQPISIKTVTVSQEEVTSS